MAHENGSGMRDIGNDRGNRGYLWFALALLAVLVGSSAQVSLRGYATSNPQPQGQTASLSGQAGK